MKKINREVEDEMKYNEMMKPFTYRSDNERKYKYRHEDLIWRSKYRAMKGRLGSLKRLHLLYEPERDHTIQHIIPTRIDAETYSNEHLPRDVQVHNRLFEEAGLFSVISDDSSSKGQVTLKRDPAKLFRENLHHTELTTTQAFGGFDVALSKSHYGKLKGTIPEIRATKDGVLRDYSTDRVKMWNINLRNDERFAHFNQTRARSGAKTKRGLKWVADKGTQSTLQRDSEVQTVYPVTYRDSFDLTGPVKSFEKSEDAEDSKNIPQLELQAGLEKVNVAAIDYLDGFERLKEQDCHKMINEIYFKPDEDIISSIYVLKSDIPSVQLMNVITVRIPVKIRFDSDKLLFSIRMKAGLVWRRLDARFEHIPGNNMFEGYVVFKTEIRGHFFATSDFIQFTYKVDKRGYKFKNALIPDLQVAVKRGSLEEPEDLTFQVRLVDRERFSKYEDLSSRLIYPVVYVTDGLWIRRNKSLYSRKVSPLLISITNDTSYGADCEVYLIREKEGRMNIIGQRITSDKKFIVLLDNNHSTFWYVVTKEINKYKSYEYILERGLSIAAARICICKILTFHENLKDDFIIWVCIVEYPYVDDTVSKYLVLNGTPAIRRLEMTQDGGKSHNIDFTPNAPDITIELDVNFKQKQFKELPVLKFKVGHQCRASFKVKCRINPLLCDEIEKYGIIRYVIGSKTIHEVCIDTARPVPDFENMTRPTPPEYSDEAIEKLLSSESLHNLASFLSEDEGLDLALRLGISAAAVSKVLTVLYGSVESKNFRLLLLWKKDISGDVTDIKDFINAFYDIERGDIGLGITDALDKCIPFKK